MWYYAGNGQGRRDMVILPYKDRLCLLGRYLQQLVMESLGKSHTRSGREVHQGITVYGQKGSTDQHAYVQQLRDGLNNFFVTFVEVLRDRDGESIEVEPGITSGDYLHGFYLGSREALTDNGRESITITLTHLDEYTLGALIALFERAVGLYAELIDVNAYDQPGVQAGKKSAREVLSLQQRVFEDLRAHRGTARTAEQIAGSIQAPDRVETVFAILNRLSSSDVSDICAIRVANPFDARYQLPAANV